MKRLRRGAHEINLSPDAETLRAVMFAAIPKLENTYNDNFVSPSVTKPVLTVRPKDSIENCMQLMTDKRIRHLPVVENDVLIGMISIGDCVRAVIEAQETEIKELKRYIAT